MTAPAPSRRRWFTFSLRTFFVVVTIFGVWLGVHVQWIRDRHVALLQVEQAGGHSDGIPRHAPCYLGPRMITLGQLPWGLRVCGEPGIRLIWIHRAPKISEPEIPRLQRLFPEATILEFSSDGTSKTIPPWSYMRDHQS